MFEVDFSLKKQLDFDNILGKMLRFWRINLEFLVQALGFLLKMFRFLAKVSA